MDRRKRPSRPGFTLIEVLIAILIVATLMAILLPAVFSALRKGRETQVTAELNNLATALASFKNTYGDFPPSRVILVEGGYNSLPAAFLSATVGDATTSVAPYNETPLADTNCSDMTVSQLVQRSRLYMRKFWPRVDFDGGSSATPPTNLDFNGNGSYSDIITLSGSECLAFFLGGIPINNGDGTFGTSGFGRSPLNPFTVGGTNRTVPNYEFVSGRLIDQDFDHVPSYIDPLDVTPGNRRAYAYFSAYGTNSYDPNDLNGYGHNVSPNFEVEDDGTTNVERGFTVSFPPGSVVSPAPNPYTSGLPVSPSVAWINPNSFQLFSAGQDRLYGLGGTFSQNTTGDAGRLPIASGDSGIVNAGDFSNGSRNRENDNLTNFSGGRLN